MLKKLAWSAGLMVALAGALPAQTIEVPYRGLDYLVTSKDGITVMVAPLDLSILNYSAAHVWITNGSKRPVQVAPQLFTTKARTARQPNAVQLAGLADGFVVGEVMERARFNDVMALVRAYERNLYGFRNPTAVSYYQQRKQIAMAEGGGKRLRAAATVSALILQKTVVPPGEFREGTVFFATGDKKAEFLEFAVRLGDLSFLIQGRGTNDRPQLIPRGTTPKTIQTP